MSLLKRITEGPPKLNILVVGECKILTNYASLVTTLETGANIANVLYFDKGEEITPYQLSPSPDIIFINVVLPDTLGLELAAKLLEHYSSSKIVVCAPNAKIGFPSTDVLHLPFTIVLKPITKENLFDLIDKIKLVNRSNTIRPRVSGFPISPLKGGGSAGSYYATDLKSRLQTEFNSKMRQLYPDGFDQSRISEAKDVFDELLAEQSMVLSRSERKRLFDQMIMEFTSLRSVLFSAYSPSEVAPKRRYGLYVYAYLNDSKSEKEVTDDVNLYKAQLGGEVPKPKSAKQPTFLSEQTTVTIVPESEDIEFEPESLTKKWRGDWTRFEFEVKPTDNLLDETIFVRISIQAAGIEIAHIKSAIEVVEDAEETLDIDAYQQESAYNPLLESKMNSQTVTPYQRIFISYSRRDTDVAKSYKIAQTALGNDAFLDVDNLRAGEDWRAALARAIDDADIFQLFWSEHSASSEYCRYEWDYALKVRCPDDTCEGFIRPVYWRKPMPSPPTELRRINFRFVPFEDQDD